MFSMRVISQDMAHKFVVFVFLVVSGGCFLFSYETYLSGSEACFHGCDDSCMEECERSAQIEALPSAVLGIVVALAATYGVRRWVRTAGPHRKDRA